MKKMFKRPAAWVLAGVMVLAQCPVKTFAYSFTGQDYNVTKNITLNGVDTGADYTRVHLGSGGSAGWGANRYINIVEVNLAQNKNLDFEVINHGSSIMGSSPLTSVVAGYSEDDNTILAAVNGDWMAYAKSLNIPVTKNYRVSFSSMLLDGNDLCDYCGKLLEHFCRDSNGDYGCDICGQWIKHTCVDADGNEACDYCGRECPKEEACLTGDINGDGKVNIADVSRLYTHVRGNKPITDADLLQYCDLNSDGRVNIADVSRLYTHVRGTKPL